jgi:hypothetical protein
MASGRPTVPRALAAAFALAEYYFPQVDEQGRTVVRVKDAHFLLTGQLHRWDQWESLSYPEAQRLGRLLAHSSDDLAGFARFERRVRQLCAPDPETGVAASPTHVTADADHPDVVIPQHGRHPLELADELLEVTPRPRKIRVATPGAWECRSRQRTQVIDIPAYPTAQQAGSGPTWPAAVTAEPLLDLDIDLAALLRTAARIDRVRPGKSFRRHHLRRLLQRMFGTASARVPLWRLTAGRTRLLNAPTAMGKSILIEVLATHLAVAGYTVAVLVVDARATHRTARDIQQALVAMGAAAICTPLVSPQTRHQRALRAVAPQAGHADRDAADADDEESLWRLDELAYGCGMTALGDPNHPFAGGGEPCHRFFKATGTDRFSDGKDEQAAPDEEADKAHWCPFAPRCDKFSQIRAACTAAVIVTNHDNFHSGRAHLPIEMDGMVRTNLTIAELLTRRAHVVLVDEIDEFQSHGFSAGTSQLVLADRSTPSTPIRRLEEHLDELAPGAAIRIRPGVQQVRYLAEQLLDLLLEKVITPDPEELLRTLRGQRTGRWTRADWYQPGSWDRMILETVFTVAEDTEPRADQLAELEALLPPAAVRDIERPNFSVLRDDLHAVRALLGQFVTIRPEQNEPDDLRQVKLQLVTELEKLGLNEKAQIRATHALVMRTWLYALRAHLYSLVEEAGTLRESGVSAAQELADGVGIYAGNHPIPYGPLGHLLFGFRFTGLTDGDNTGQLTLELIRGDAHAVTARLGDVVSLAYAGHRRIVLGLSATACLFGAAREHIFVDPDWSVPDTDAGEIVAMRSHVVNATGAAVEVGGTALKHRLARVAELGQGLGPMVAGWLARLRADQRTAHRARTLLATNSYAQSIQLANGLVLGASAIGQPPAVFAAVPDDPDRRMQLPAVGSAVTRIARDQFERFADLDGEVLVAPISVVARALNILSTSDKGRRESAITIVGLCVRPVMPVTEPAELAANIAAFAYQRATTSSQPAELLDQLRKAAAHRLGVLLTAPRQFSALPSEIQRDLVAGLMGDLIQLVGRARRGQTKAELHFIDGALHNTRWSSDLPSLIRLLYQSWNDHERQLMHQVYGTTLAVLLDYAGITST